MVFWRWWMALHWRWECVSARTSVSFASDVRAWIARRRMTMINSECFWHIEFICIYMDCEKWCSLSRGAGISKIKWLRHWVRGCGDWPCGDVKCRAAGANKFLWHCRWNFCSYNIMLILPGHLKWDWDVNVWARASALCLASKSTLAPAPCAFICRMR